MKVYKATGKDMQCKGLQYEIGKTVEAVGEIKLCKNGLHACTSPLDLFSYYSPADGSRYFEAEAEDVSDERGDDSKIVAKKLTLGAEIGIPGLVQAHIEFVKSKTTTEFTDPKHATAGSYGAATAGDNGAATAGFRGAATAGDNGAATAGDNGAATAGFRGAATAGGKAATGREGLSVVRGNRVMAKGGIGAIIVVAIENDTNCAIKEWKAGMIDGETLKPDIWYTLKNGEFVEVKEDA